MTPRKIAGMVERAELVDFVFSMLYPHGFRSGKYYNQSPGLDPEMSTAGIAITADTVLYYPLVIRQNVTVDALGCRIATLEAGKSIAIGIYSDTGSFAPDAKLIEGEVATDAAVAVADTSLTPATYDFTPGLYWWAINSDNAGTARVRTLLVNEDWPLLGLGGSANAGAYQTTQYTEALAYGSGPLPASATPAGENYSTTLPMVKLRAA